MLDLWSKGPHILEEKCFNLGPFINFRANIIIDFPTLFSNQILIYPYFKTQNFMTPLKMKKSVAI